MEYRVYNGVGYLRLDRGDGIVSSVLDFCRREGFATATFSGLGGCGEAEIKTFDPETRAYGSRTLSGMLELVSLWGDVTGDGNGGLTQHTHALFAYVENGEHKTAGGHLGEATVLVTAEIEVRPAVGGAIGRKADPVWRTKVWDFGNRTGEEA